MAKNEQFDEFAILKQLEDEDASRKNIKTTNQGTVRVSGYSVATETGSYDLKPAGYLTNLATKGRKNVSNWVASKDKPYEPIDHKDFDPSRQTFEQWTKGMERAAGRKITKQNIVDTFALQEGIDAGSDKALVELGLLEPDYAVEADIHMLKTVGGFQHPESIADLSKEAIEQTFKVARTSASELDRSSSHRIKILAERLHPADERSI